VMSGEVIKRRRGEARMKERNTAGTAGLGTDRHNKQCKNPLSIVDDYLLNYINHSLYAHDGCLKADTAKAPGLVGSISSYSVYPQFEATPTRPARGLARHHPPLAVPLSPEPATAHSCHRMGLVLPLYYLGSRKCKQCTDNQTSKRTIHTKR
jgi:hypothetical protein